MSDLPERINVIRTVSYDIAALRSEVMKDLGIELSTPDDVIDYISDWVYEDMTAPPSRHDLVYQDENGNEL